MNRPLDTAAADRIIDLALERLGVNRHFIDPRFRFYDCTTREELAEKILAAVEEGRKNCSHMGDARPIVNFPSESDYTCVRCGELIIDQPVEEPAPEEEFDALQTIVQIVERRMEESLAAIFDQINEAIRKVDNETPEERSARIMGLLDHLPPVPTSQPDGTRQK